MKLAFAAALLAAGTYCSVSAFNPSGGLPRPAVRLFASPPEYDDASRAAYDSWREKFGKGDFDETRYTAFRQNYSAAARENALAKEEVLTLDEFADWTETEVNDVTAAAGVLRIKNDISGGSSPETEVSLEMAGAALAEAAEELARDEQVRKFALT